MSRLFFTVQNFCFLVIALNLTSYAQFPLGICNGIDNDPDKKHISINLDWIPDIKIYANNQCKGDPVFHLNNIGLYYQGQLLCSWPGSSITSVDESNRVLGFDGYSVSKPCPPGLPIKSGWGDQGRGPGVLCIEITNRSENIIEVTYKGKPYYLDLNTIPEGRWGIEQAENEIHEANRAEVASLLKDKEFSDFLADIRACLKQKDPKTCFSKFVVDTMYYPEAASKFSREWYVNLEQFVEFIWSPENTDLANVITACLNASGYPDIQGGGDYVYFYGNDYRCTFRHTYQGWRLEHFEQLP